MFSFFVVTLPELRVATYSSMLSKGGLAEFIEPAFEKVCACDLKFEGAPDAGTMIQRLRMQKTKKPAVVLGVDQNLFGRAGDLADRPSKKIVASKEFDLDDRFVAFDHGVFAFIADTKHLKNLPRSFKDLLKPEYKQKILVQNPQTSSPGLSLSLFLSKYFKDDRAKFERQWLAVTSGWDEAYGLFTKEQAPLVWSYISSEAYHRMEGAGDRYQALLFEEGHPTQIEGAFLVKDVSRSAKQTELAESFLSFLISKEVQDQIASRHYMMPVLKDAAMPKEYAALPTPKKVWQHLATPAEIEANRKEWNLIRSQL